MSQALAIHFTDTMFVCLSDIKANQLRWSWPTAEQVPDKAEHCHEMQVSMKKLVRFVQAKLK